MDCTNAGPAELTIEIISDSGTEAEVHIQDNGDGTYTITYIPLYPGSYTLTIRYGGQDVPNFPARLNVEPAVDASGVLVFGPGVEGKGQMTRLTQFCGFVAVCGSICCLIFIIFSLHCPSLSRILLKLCTYLKGNSYFGSLSNITRAYGYIWRCNNVLYVLSFVLGVFREATTDFTVDARALTQTGGDHIKTHISNPSGSRTDALITDLRDGTYSVEYTPYEEGEFKCSSGYGRCEILLFLHFELKVHVCVAGPHTVEVCYDGSPVPKSPFRVAVTEGCDPARVRVHGPGLKGGTTNKPNKFTVETRYETFVWTSFTRLFPAWILNLLCLLQRSGYWWARSSNGRSIRGQNVLH